MNLVMKRPSYGYVVIDKEDPEEIVHRRAQFLIYKALEEADYRKKSSFFRLRLCRLKVKIGKRLKRLRKNMLVCISASKAGVYKQLISQLKSLRRFFGHGRTAIAG